MLTRPVNFSTGYNLTVPIESGQGVGQADTMIEDIEIDTVTEELHATRQDDFEDVISIDAEDNSFFPVTGNNPNTFPAKHMISPFVMAMVGAGIMMSVFLCTMIAFVMRIAMKSRLDKKRKGLNNRKTSISSGCGGFEQQPRF